MPSVQYFNPEEFIQRVIADCHFGTLEEPMLGKMKQLISDRLEERVTAATVNLFGEKEFTLLERMLEDHPELEEVDAVAMVAKDLPGLAENLTKTIQDLYEELTEDAENIAQAMDQSQKQQ